jgi:hypothetical protein
MPTVSPIEGSHSAGDRLPPKRAVIRFAELKQLFNSIDPSLFATKISIRKRRKSSSVGQRTCHEMRPWVLSSI